MPLTFRFSRLGILAAAACMIFASCSSEVTTSPSSEPTPTPIPPPDVDRLDWFIWTEGGGFKAIHRPAGFSRVAVWDVNSSGQVVGTRWIDGPNGARQSRAFIWSEADGYKDIMEASSAVAQSIDDEGNVVGTFISDGPPHGFRWNASSGRLSLEAPGSLLFPVSVSAPWVAFNSVKSRPTGGTYVVPQRLNTNSGQLEELPTSASGGQVIAINDVGMAVGYDGLPDIGFSGGRDAVVWDTRGVKTTVFSCSGEFECNASTRSINNKGVAVGSMYARGNLISGAGVFMWSADEGTKFLALGPSLKGNPIAVGIADDGTVLVDNAGTPLIVRSTGTPTELQAPVGYKSLAARAISRNGTVVGNIN